MKDALSVANREIVTDRKRATRSLRASNQRKSAI